MSDRPALQIQSLPSVVKFWPIIAGIVAVTASFAVTQARVDGLAKEQQNLATKEVVDIKFQAILLHLESIDRRLERMDARK